MNRCAIAVAPTLPGSRESAARSMGGIVVAYCLALAGVAAAETAPLGEGDPVMAAMRDEMTRSLQELKLEGSEGPYFIAYRVFDVVSERANASLGSLLNRGTGASRQLVVELRVGSHDFDNTNYVASSPSRAVRAALPLGDDYDAMRRQVWLATDRAYKQAVNDLSGKRAALQNRTRVEEIPDFSREPPHRHDGRASGKFEPGRSEEMVLAVSGAFRAMPELHMSEVRANAQQSRTYFVDSEGSAFITDRHSVQVEALAGVQAADGVELQDFVTAYGNSWAGIPEAEALAAQAKQMANRLLQRRDAPYLDRYTGPVLFEGQAAAELINQVLAPRLVALRMPLVENPRMRSMMTSVLGNPFLDRLNARVLPRFLAVVNDPTVPQAADDAASPPFVGTYAVDDDGMPARRVSLIERGVLKALLATRTPVLGITASTGSRRGETPSPGNLFIEARGGFGEDELREELMLLAEERELEYALVVRRIGSSAARLVLGAMQPSALPGMGGDGANVQPLIAAYRVYPDGREEPIRTAVLSGVTEATFRDIVAASDATSRHDLVFFPLPALAALPGMSGVVGTPTTYSMVVPSLLFEDITVKRPSGDLPQQPLVPPPPSATADGAIRVAPSP